MKRRAEQVERTRDRIVEVAVRLHGTVGPAKTTIAGIAAAAGVTRLTVYRHFPDEESLYAACSARWMSGQVMPDPVRWSKVPDPRDRLRAGLSDLYRYYRDGEAMLTRVLGDLDHMPEGMRRRISEAHAGYLRVLRAPFGARARNKRLRAALGHAASYWTWRSLCRDGGLSNRSAVQLMTGLVTTSSRAGHRGAPPS